MNNSEKTNSSESKSNIGAWLYGVLTLVGAGLFLYTWFQPWWVAYIEELQQKGVVIYPHAMNILGTLRDYPQWIEGSEMPPFFFPLMWVFLAICIFSLFASLLYTEEWFNVGKYKVPVAQFLVGLAGFGYTVFVIVFALTVAILAPNFGGVKLQGSVFISVNEHTESFVTSSLQPGYWIACFVGPGLLLLAFLRNKILALGKSKS
jgi:hypothetical protein